MKLPTLLNRTINVLLAPTLTTIVMLVHLAAPATAATGQKQPGKLMALLLQVEASDEIKTNQVLLLKGANARQQILVTAKFDTGALRDFTREVNYEVSPAG